MKDELRKIMATIIEWQVGHQYRLSHAQHDTIIKLLEDLTDLLEGITDD